MQPGGGLRFRVKGSEFVLPVNVAIIGVGTTANPLIQSTTPDLATNSRNYIVADPQTMRTSKRGVFAGGDIVTGAAHRDSRDGSRPESRSVDSRVPDQRRLVEAGQRNW